jgi:hypothetical protein
VGMRSVGYNGKALHSWLQLPPEVIWCVYLYFLSFFLDFLLAFAMIWDLEA